MLLLIWNTWTKTSTIKTFPGIPAAVTAFVMDLCQSINVQQAFFFRYLSCQLLLAPPTPWIMKFCLCVCVTCCPFVVCPAFNQLCGDLTKSQQQSLCHWWWLMIIMTAIYLPIWGVCVHVGVGMCVPKGLFEGLTQSSHATVTARGLWVIGSVCPETMSSFFTPQ